MNKFDVTLGTAYCIIGILLMINGSLIEIPLGMAYGAVGILLVLKGVGLISRGFAANRVRIE